MKRTWILSAATLVFVAVFASGKVAANDHDRDDRHDQQKENASCKASESPLST